MLAIGMTATEQMIVNLGKSASELGGDGLEVLSMASLAALVEQACMNALHQKISAGRTTVAVSMDVNMTGYSPLGVTVGAKCELAKIEGDVLTFDVNVFDKSGIVATATHARRIVNAKTFMDEAQARKH